MKCECGAISTILVEGEDGTITLKCDQCYYDPKFATTERDNRQPEDSLDKKCTHPRGYIKSVRICGLCGEQLSE